MPQVQQLESRAADAAAAPAAPHITPLPASQVACVLMLQMCEGFDITVLFPFVVFMVRDFGIADHEHEGEYVGALAASFCTAQFLSSVFWGRLSDRIGRKKTLIAGAVGSLIASLVFGTSVHYAQAVLGRALSGALNGNVGVLKSFLAEITDESNRHFGFSLMPLAFGLGSVVGPMVGGLLSQPDAHFPYLAPILVGVALKLISTVMCFFLMVEPPRRPRAAPVRGSEGGVQLTATSKKYAELEEEEEEVDVEAPAATTKSSAYAALDESSGEEGEEPEARTITQLLSDRDVVLGATSYGLLAFVYVVFDETAPLLLAETEEGHGFAFTDHQIGVLLAVGGGELILWTMLLQPKLKARFDNITLYIWAMVLVTPLFLIFPAMAWLDAEPEPMWGLLVVWFGFKQACGATAFTSTMLFLNHAVPGYELGAANGLGQSFAALARGTGPFLGGVLWSWSLTFDSWEYHTFILNVFLVALCVLCVLLGVAMPTHLARPYGASSSSSA